MGRVQAVPRCCELYPGICLTTEEKAWKNLSQGSRRVPVGTMKTECTEQSIHNNNNTQLTKLTFVFCVCVCVCVKRMILRTVPVEGCLNSLSCPQASLKFAQNTVKQAGPTRFITLVMFCLMAYCKGRLYVHKYSDYRVASLLFYWQA